MPPVGGPADLLRTEICLNGVWETALNADGNWTFRYP